MPNFTKGKWTADDMGEYVFAHGFDMIICQMRGWGYLNANRLSPNEIIDVQIANARLIAAAPEMYDWIEKTCRFLHDLKRYAHDEDEMRDHAEDLNATYNNLLTDAYLMLVRIDGEEAQS